MWDQFAELYRTRNGVSVGVADFVEQGLVARGTLAEMLWRYRDYPPINRPLYAVRCDGHWYQTPRDFETLLKVDGSPFMGLD